jgi:hypothetical protein
MGGIGYIIGGALQGIGEGLEKQTILNEDTRQKTALADLQARRDAALAALNHQYRTQEAQTAAVIDDTKDANHQARAFSYSTKETQQKQGYEQQNIVLKGKVDFQNDSAIEALKSRYHIAEGAAEDARDLQKQLALAGVTADHWEVTTDGRIVAFNKQGGVLRYSANPDSFVPKKGDDEDLTGGGTIGAERANRGGGSAAKPAAKSNPTGQQSPDQARQQGAALAALGNAYAEASQNPQQFRSKYPGMFDANGNLLPRDVLIQRVKQRYGG